MSTRRFHSQHNAIIKFKEPELTAVLFTTKEGGDSQSEVTQQFPGGNGPPVNVPGPTTITPVTLTKPFDPVVDAALLAWSKQWDLGIRRPLTLVVTPTTAEGISIKAGKVTYQRCAKVTLSYPSYSKGGAETATLSLTVQPEYIL